MVYRNVASCGLHDLVCEYGGRFYGVQVKYRAVKIIKGKSWIINTKCVLAYERTDIMCYVGAKQFMCFETNHKELRSILKNWR